jgi:single-stranded DNA-binding protein
MNSFILMAEIVSEPQLRYTPDEQIPVLEMRVQFPGIRAEDAPANIKVTAWRVLATEIDGRYHQGDRVIIEGRLGMNNIEIDGIKEKRAEVTASKIYKIGSETDMGAVVERSQLDIPKTDAKPLKTPVESKKVATVDDSLPRTPVAARATKTPVVEPPAANEQDLDEIPF